MHEFYSIFNRNNSNTRTIINTWLVWTKFNMTTLLLDNHRQSFWTNHVLMGVMAIDDIRKLGNLSISLF